MSNKVNGQRAKSTRSSRKITAGPLCLDLETRQVAKNGSTHKLTPKECALLKTFMSHSGKILTRKFLMREVWETDYVEDTRTLEVHVHWIRRYIEDNPGKPVYLRTVRGVGYRFDPDSANGRGPHL